MNEPRAETSASVEVLCADCTKQFVPFARHTAEPFTKIAEALSVDPEALLNPSHTVEVTEPIVAELAFNVPTVPDDAVNVLSVVLPTTVKVEVTVELEPTKPP